MNSSSSISSAANLDPITLEILSNALRSITDETFIALMKSAYSTNIKERNDHSTAIMDPAGDWWCRRNNPCRFISPP